LLTDEYCKNKEFKQIYKRSVDRWIEAFPVFQKGIDDFKEQNQISLPQVLDICMQVNYYPFNHCSVEFLKEIKSWYLSVNASQSVIDKINKSLQFRNNQPNNNKH